MAGLGTAPVDQEYGQFKVRIRVGHSPDVFVDGTLDLGDVIRLGYIEISVERVRFIHKVIKNDGFFARSPFVLSYLDEKLNENYSFFDVDKSEDEQARQRLKDALQRFTLSTLSRRIRDTDTSIPVSAEEVMEFLNRQPGFVDFVEVIATMVQDSASSDDDQTTESEAAAERCLLVMDEECICLFAPDMTCPKYRLLFWKVPAKDSIERIKLMPGGSTGLYEGVITMVTVNFQIKLVWQLLQACLTQNTIGHTYGSYTVYLAIDGLTGVSFGLRSCLGIS